MYIYTHNIYIYIYNRRGVLNDIPRAAPRHLN